MTTLPRVPEGLTLPEIWCPLAVEVHPDAGLVEDVLLAWATAFGLVADEAAARRFSLARYGVFTAYTFPHAADLPLAAQWNAAFGPATVALTDAGQTHSTVGPNDPPPAWLDAALLIWRPDLASPRALVSQLIQSTVATHDLPTDLAQVLAQLAQADAGGGGADPQALYQQAERALVAGAYICPVGQPGARYLVRPTVRGYVVDALGAVPLDAWVEMSVAAS